MTSFESNILMTAQSKIPSGNKKVRKGPAPPPKQRSSEEINLACTGN